tara:strand:- start:109 stop:1644 length:1536 start_codon:yes stop_codon:yes gene_type:complete
MEILDCTIRDGGYYTNWDFDKNLIKSYLKNLDKLPVDYLEVGYRSASLTGYYGEYFYCTIDTINFLSSNSNKKLVIILDEKNFNIDLINDLLDPCKGKIDMIRMAIDPQNFHRAVKKAKIIKLKGFKIAFNLMYMSKWDRYPGLIESFNELNDLVDYLYLVDSYGGVYPNDVRDIIGKVRKSTNVKIGFHGHNNLEMALANSLVAIESGIDILDSTLTGMGRGAGNLKTELLLTTLNTKYGLDVDYDALSDITGKFQDLQEEYKWGTSLPYMISGSNSLPQNKVMDWISKNYYSINSITRALSKSIPNKNKDNSYEFFKSDLTFDTVVIIGGGSSINKHHQSILKYLNLNNDKLALIHASSKNAKYFEDLKIEQFFCLVGNEGIRLEDVFEDLRQFDGKCILPPSPRNMGTYVPKLVINKTYELDQITFTNLNTESHTSIALQTSLNLGAKTIYLLGYDGYEPGLISDKFQELFIENSKLFNDIPENIDCISLTPTKYNGVKKSSIYKLIK